MSLSDLFTGKVEGLGLLLWPMFAGIIVAACAVLYNKQVLGKLVNKLFEAKAESAASARTLSDLGLGGNIFIRFALRDGSTLRKVVKATTISQESGLDDTRDDPTRELPVNDKYTINSKLKGPNLRFYIPEECTHRAEVTYNPDGSSIISLIITVIVFLALTLILLTLIPDLITMVKNAYTKS